MDYENHDGKKDSMPKGRRNFLKSTAVAGTTIFAFPMASKSIQGGTNSVESNSSGGSLTERYDSRLGKNVVTITRNLNLSSPSDYEPYLTSRATAGLDADGDDADIIITRGLSLSAISHDARDNIYYHFRYQAMGFCVEDVYGEIKAKEPFLSDHFIEMNARGDCDLGEMYTDGPYLRTKSDIPEGVSLSGWSTGKDDLYSADRNVDKISRVLGVSSVILGLAAFYPALTVGAAATLTGSSAAVGIGSLMSGFDVESEQTKTDNNYQFEMKESGWNGTNDLAIWVHDLGFILSVPKGQSEDISFNSGVRGSEIVGGSNTEMSWVDNWGNKGGLKIFFDPVYTAEEAINNLPRIYYYDTDYDKVIDSHSDTLDPIDPSGPDKCTGDYCINSTAEE